jgi:hypothetical protein
MQAHGIGGPRDCAGALSMFRAVIGRLPQTPALSNAHELLADGKPQGACVTAAAGAGVCGAEAALAQTVL